jgi:IS66 C-terminal element
MMQSLLTTCRLHRIDPYDYLVDVLQRISQHPASRVDELTPRRWKELSSRLLLEEHPLRTRGRLESTAITSCRTTSICAKSHRASDAAFVELPLPRPCQGNHSEIVAGIQGEPLAFNRSSISRTRAAVSSESPKAKPE